MWRNKQRIKLKGESLFFSSCSDSTSSATVFILQPTHGGIQLNLLCGGGGRGGRCGVSGVKGDRGGLSSHVIKVYLTVDLSSSAIQTGSVAPSVRTIQLYLQTLFIHTAFHKKQHLSKFIHQCWRVRLDPVSHIYS